MRTAALRYCLSGFLFAVLPVATHASLEYSIRTEQAQLFRTQTLEPPPLATLSQGESLKLIYRGPAQSMVETSGGMKGWVRNGDLQAMESPRGQKFGLGEQKVTGDGELAISPLTLKDRDLTIDVIDLNRSFAGEIVEAIDKEQLEMKNGDN